MSKGDPTKHDMSVDRTKEHISTKVYMFPESYNALRRELVDHWPNLWNSPVQYMMWNNGPMFVQAMDLILDTVTQFDTENVDGICKKFLDELRVKRGLSRLHSPAEYNNNDQMELAVRLARAMHEVPPWKQ
jgi:hypothetical protein